MYTPYVPNSLNVTNRVPKRIANRVAMVHPSLFFLINKTAVGKKEGMDMIPPEENVTGCRLGDNLSFRLMNNATRTFS